MNNLEKALLDDTNQEIDGYLFHVSLDQFRSDIEEIKKKSRCDSPSGLIKEELMRVLDKL